MSLAKTFGGTVIRPDAILASSSASSLYQRCRMDLPGPTTSVGTRTNYTVGPWDYPTCAARYLMA
jgi:hypothetical protein